MKRKLRVGVRTNPDGIPQDLAVAYKEGKVSRDEVYDILKSRYQTSIQRSFANAPVEVALDAYRGANDVEKVQLREDMLQKLYRMFKTAPADRIKLMADVLDKGGMLDKDNLNDPKLAQWLQEYRAGNLKLMFLQRRVAGLLSRSERIEKHQAPEIQLNALKAKFNRTVQ